MGITGMDWETGIEGIVIDGRSSLEVGSSRMKITGVNCEGSTKNKEDKVILDSDISDEEFLEDINGLDGLVPTPYYYYIDLKSSNKPLFKVNILIEKS